MSLVKFYYGKDYANYYLSNVFLSICWNFGVLCVLVILYILLSLEGTLVEEYPWSIKLVLVELFVFTSDFLSALLRVVKC